MKGAELKKRTFNFIFVFTIFFLVSTFTSCGKKDATTTGTTDSKKETTSSGSSSEIDGMIDQYQKLMDEYVAVVKDVKAGKTTEMAKMQELSTKTTEWAKKLADLAPKLTPQQSERIRKISDSAAEQMK